MNKFAIGSQSQWCQACGNTTGVCAATSANPAASSSSAAGSGNGGSGNGISTAVGGVIGAMVTLAVVLGLEALLMLVFGLRVVSKKRLAGAGTAANGITKETA